MFQVPRPNLPPGKRTRRPAIRAVVGRQEEPIPQTAATITNEELPPTFFDESSRQSVRVHDTISNISMVADTGATWSIMPAEDRSTLPRLDLFRQASGVPIAIYDYKERQFDIGLGKVFHHKFFLGDVNETLLGYDFLARNDIAVDCAAGKL
ncbi:Hypothetical predicted protein, partial [Paramuricea clavata]